MLVAKSYEAMQYDGTNGSAIAAALGITVDSDNGQVLELGGMNVNVGQWVVWSINVRFGQVVKDIEEMPLDDSVFQAKYHGV